MRKKVSAILAIAPLVSAGAYLLFSAPFAEGPKVAVVGIERTIDDFGTSHKVAKLSRRESVEAVVLEINSPGGYVSPSFQLERAISELSRRKPTVAIVSEYEIPFSSFQKLPGAVAELFSVYGCEYENVSFSVSVKIIGTEMDLFDEEDLKGLMEEMEPGEEMKRCPECGHLF